MGTKIKIISTFFICLLISNAKGQFNNKNIYYFIVANEHYSIDFENFQQGFQGLTNLEEATASAGYMEGIFKKWGAKKGVFLQSTTEKKLYSKQIFKSLDSLLKTIKKAKDATACIFFYYAGHGFSSKKLEALYLPDGNFTKNPDSLVMEDWDKHATVALDIHEKLQQAKLPHLMFFDCCYSGRQDTPERLSKEAITHFGLETMDNLMGDTYTLLTAMFQMVGPNPVIFSTKPGYTVPTVPLNDSTDAEYVAPLCRRVLAINNAGTFNPVTNLTQWMEAILNKDVDALTATATSYWVPEESK